MSNVEKYLKPEVIHQIKRLDLRAKFVVKGFMQGLHRSPFHGFSVEFSEHRRYAPGDDPKDIDWLVYAKTDKYYVKKFEAETNLVGYLVIDLSRSMGYTYRQELTKFDYSVCIAAALCYLMIGQQDPVGLLTFDDKIRTSLPPKSKRSHLGSLLALLARLQPNGQTDIAKAIQQISAMLKQRSLVMIFSDLQVESAPLIQALHRLRHPGHDVILFHVLDEAEVSFPFDGLRRFEDLETGETIDVDADAFRDEYRRKIEELREFWQEESSKAGIDYVPLDTSMPFDRALIEYLHSRKARF